MQRKQWFVTFIIVVAILLLILSVASVSAQGPQPQSPSYLPGAPFTYQGQLKKNGAPVNGTCDIAFRLYTDAVGGSLANTTDPITQTLPVTNGLFTTELAFGTLGLVFDGQPRWLDMQVRCPAGSGGFTLLNPRQSLTPAPMAQTLVPGAYIGGDTNIVTFPILGVENLASTGAGNAIRARSHTPNGSAIWATDDIGNGLTGGSTTGTGVAGYSTSGIGVRGDSTSGYAGIFNGRVAVSGTLNISSSLSFGATTRQMINLWNQVYGIGVQNWAQYFRSDGGFAWFRQGTHSDTTNDPGAGGTTMMTLSPNGNLDARYGTVKAAVFATCASTGAPNPSSMIRSFNNVNGATITITGTAGGGICRIDFGFPLSDRYLVVSSSRGGQAVIESRTTAAVDSISGNTADVVRWRFDGNYDNGNIFVLVY